MAINQNYLTSQSLGYLSGIKFPELCKKIYKQTQKRKGNKKNEYLAWYFKRKNADDHDPLDVLVLCHEDIVPLTLVECYPIGVLIMTDNEQKDEKIIAICKQDPFLNGYQDITQIPLQTSSEIKHFFEVYKQLEGKATMVEKSQKKLLKNVWNNIMKNMIKKEKHVWKNNF